jgi:2-polyprenyl-3-methyl-5-hydroxy-6-metoxy-1,4-benzoquinol methylase
MNTQQSLGPAHFERLYEGNADPWRFRTSVYEQAKYRRTIEALGTRRFRSAFEVGCSVGVLTHMLGERCDSVLAVDFVDQPLETARAGCADQPWVRFEKMRVPDGWPAGSFDLILLSEVLYFLAPADVATVADRAVGSLDVDGLVVLVNWLGRAGDPCTGDEAAEFLISRAAEALRPVVAERADSYRLDVLERA